MKKNFLAVTLILILAGFSVTAFAQYDEPEITSHKAPKWLSATGYWEVESNIHQSKHNILYFYNNDNVLVYKETIDGMVININKRKTKMRLKKLVDQTVAAFTRHQQAAENQMLAIKLIRK